MVTEQLLTDQSTAKNNYLNPFFEGKSVKQEEFSSD